MKGIEDYTNSLTEYLDEIVVVKEPKELYNPIRYIVSLGGKRLRPILTLMSCDFFNTEYKKALPAALALELFHNFSLIHDDIMDEAPLRRGKETVHSARAGNVRRFARWSLRGGILGRRKRVFSRRDFSIYPNLRSRRRECKRYF